MKILALLLLLLLAGCQSPNLSGDAEQPEVIIKDEPIVEKPVEPTQPAVESTQKPRPTAREKVRINELVAKYEFTKTEVFEAIRANESVDSLTDPRLMTQDEVLELVKNYNKFLGTVTLDNLSGNIIEQLNARIILLTK